MSGIICRECNHENPVGASICESCQKELNPNTDWVDEPAKPIKKPHGGTTPFTDDIYLYIQDSDVPLIITRERLEESPVIIGRVDTSGGQSPTIDLTRYQAKEKGVSRRHVALSYDRGGLMIADQGSSNYTLVNGNKLAPYQARVLCNGDVVHLGRLAIRVQFRRHSR